MSQAELSKRAKAVLNWMADCHPALDAGSSKLRNDTGSRLGGRDDNPVLAIRQQTLADLLSCSRRSIYRALQELKKHGILKETGKREKRCKVYQFFPRSGNVNIAPGDSPRDWVTPASKDPKGRLSNQNSIVPSAGKPLTLTLSHKGRGNMTPESIAHLKLYRHLFESTYCEWPDWEKFYPEATCRIDGTGHLDKYSRLAFDNLYLIQERETGMACSARLYNTDSTLFAVPYPQKPPANQIDYILRTRPTYRPYRPAR